MRPIRVGRVRAYVWLTSTWFMGYQTRGDMAGTDYVDILVIPGVVVSVGWYRGW